jgi:hypothetical protein
MTRESDSCAGVAHREETHSDPAKRLLTVLPSQKVEILSTQRSNVVLIAPSPIAVRHFYYATRKADMSGPYIAFQLAIAV